MHNPDTPRPGPLVVQGDLSLLLEVDHPLHGAARDAVSPFAELVKAPEYMHTFRITPLSVWNGVSAGLTGDDICRRLQRHSRYPVPNIVLRSVRDMAGRFGLLRLVRADDDTLALETDDPTLMDRVLDLTEVTRHTGRRLGRTAVEVAPLGRGHLKVALIKAGLPADDLAGYRQGEPLDLALRRTTASGQPFSLRPYQAHAVRTFHAGGAARGGSGVVVLPCGAGKTVVGMAVMVQTGACAVVVATGVTAARQWIAELLDKTTLTEDQVGEYTGQAKQVRQVTVTTYQTLTHRDRKADRFTHFDLFDRRDWGLVIYDEVHLLPAPVFQLTAGLQARRRLGLTATLVREDNRQDDVFVLIGPKRFDVPWKEMERQGWIATATCTEVRVPVSDALEQEIFSASARQRFRLAAENQAKLPLVRALLRRHEGEPTLVIGMYLDQLQALAKALAAPLLSGRTGARRRQELYGGFRRGEIPILVVSKVANFAVDLPDAAVAIQVSGTFGSRQEEAQRLGRLLRPKAGRNRAHFYTLVSRNTDEQSFALNRQLFLVEQGYAYRIVDGEDLLEPSDRGKGATP